MSAHRRVRTQRTKVRRLITAAVLAVSAGAGSLITALPANAAGPWFVAPGGLAANTCLSVGSPCGTVSQVVGKAGFVDGDTIFVAAGSCTD
jgi:hypothetical protein